MLSFSAAAQSPAPAEGPQKRLLTLTLKEAFEKALRSNSDLQLAQEKSKEAAALSGVAFASLLPTISGQATVESAEDAPANPGAAFNAETYNWYSATLMARQPLLKGGSLWNLNSAAGTSEEIAKLDVVKVEQDVLYDVLEAFLSTFVLQERKAVFERQVKEQERLLRRARQWTGMGTEARMVVLQFQTQLAAYEAEVLTSGAALSRQSVQLLSLIGDREAQELRLEGGLDIAQQLILDVTKLGLPTERPEFRQAELRVQYAEANQVIQMASHWPSLSLFASAGRQGSQRSNLFDADYTSWRAGIQLDVPLFSGLSSFAERSRYASTLAQARVQESKQRDTSVRDRVQAEQNYEASRVLLEARRKVVDAAREAHRLGTSLYTNGAIPYTQFAEADRRVVEAEVAYNEIRRDHALNIASMYRAGNRSLRELIPQR